jgi:site-specific DNA-methyltransferase (adenine-specific)
MNAPPRVSGENGGTSDLRNQILVGDALKRLRSVDSGTIDMAVTSPPYFRLRHYQHDGQIGLEASVNEWIEQVRGICREVARVLVPTGTLWLNLGDTYSTHSSQGAPRKSLIMAPERLALALQADGYIVRNKLVWSKTNPMPSNAKDRLSCTYEVVYVLARNPTYFFDLDAIREPHRSKPSRSRRRVSRGPETWRGPNGDTASGLDRLKAEGRVGHPLGKNPGDVWSLGTGTYRSEHHATYPATLARRMIQAGCPEARCTACRLPWRRNIIRPLGGAAVRSALAATCACGAPNEPGLVLDPFIGSGTTAVAAEDLDRDWLGVELNPAFVKIANDRITQDRIRRRSDTQRRTNPKGAAA